MPWLTVGVLAVFTPIAIVRLLAARGATPLVWPVIGILSMALVGTAVSPDRAVSLQKLAGIVLGALALAAVQARARSAVGFTAATFVFVVMATLAVAAARSPFCPRPAGRCRRVRRAANGAGGDRAPNGVAGLILLARPGSWCCRRPVRCGSAPGLRSRRAPFSLDAAGRACAGTAALGLAMLVTLVASRSRSGVVGLVAAMVLVLALRLVSSRRPVARGSPSRPPSSPPSSRSAQWRSTRAAACRRTWRRGDIWDRAG